MSSVTCINVRGSIPAEARFFSLFRNVQTGFGIHPASFTVGTGVVSQALTNHPHLAPMLGRSTVTLLLPPLCLTARDGETFTFFVLLFLSLKNSKI